MQSFLSSYHIPGQVSTAAKFLQVKFLHSFYTILSQFNRILFWYMNYIKVREHQIMTNEQYYSLIQSYEDARKILISRLEILDHSLYGNHTESGPVHTIQSRIKSKDSIEEKLKRSGKTNSIANARDYLLDIAGIPVYCLDTMEYFPVEVQLRTMSMDFWASMEHRICYKKNPHGREQLSRDFKIYADILEEIERQLEGYSDIKKKIE